MKLAQTKESSQIQPEVQRTGYYTGQSKPNMPHQDPEGKNIVDRAKRGLLKERIRIVFQKI